MYSNVSQPYLQFLKGRNTIGQMGPNLVLKKLVVHLQVTGIWLLCLRTDTWEKTPSNKHFILINKDREKRPGTNLLWRCPGDVVPS